jgi:hypothetical protein
MAIQTQFCDRQRIAASEMIEKKVVELSRNIGMADFGCNWNSGQGINHSSLHRLNICADGKTAQIYFTDHELAAYWNGRNGPATDATDTRLEHVIDELHENDFSSAFLSWMPGAQLPRKKF